MIYWLGITALQRAAQFGHPDIVKFLIKNGASMYEKDEDGRTVICN